jgi:DNA-binding NarL/FixJ family response regulator
MARLRLRADPPGVITVLIVDDHPAVRAGLYSVLRIEPGIVPVGTCGSVAEATELAEDLDPRVLLVDYELPDGDGLELCMRFYRRGVRSLVYSAYSQRVLAASSLLAGASGLLHKAAGGDELCDAIRCVARGLRLFPPISREVLDVCAHRLDPDDLPILGMTIEGSSRSDIAEALRLDERELERRLERMVTQLRPSTGLLRRVSAIGDAANTG